MGSTRQFPPDEAAATKLADRAAPRHAPTHAGAEPTRWPVIARIGEIRRADESGAASDTPPSSHTTYRLDAPHAATPSPVHTNATPETATASPPTKVVQPPTAPATASQARVLQAAPLPIRIAVEAWQIVLPHRELIRFAAMLALMAAGGMSAALMMGDRFLPADEPANPVTTTARQTGGVEAATQHAELEPTLEPAIVPDNDTSAAEPTATGPLTPTSRPLMAIESQEPTAAMPYPVTAYAEPTLPQLRDGSLPQVKTTEPDVALRGDLIKTKIR